MKEELIRGIVRILDGLAVGSLAEESEALAEALRPLVRRSSGLRAAVRAEVARVLAKLLGSNPPLVRQEDSEAARELASEADEVAVKASLILIGVLIESERLQLDDVRVDLRRIAENARTELAARVISLYEVVTRSGLEEVRVEDLIRLYARRDVRAQFEEALLGRFADCLSITEEVARNVLETLGSLVHDGGGTLRVCIPLTWPGEEMGGGWFLAPSQIARAEPVVADLPPEQRDEIARVLAGMSQCPA